MRRFMLRSRSVLIIEDEPLIAMMLEDFIESLGHTVAGCVDSVSGALERVEAGGFDIAILDVHLREGKASWPVADALADRGIAFVLATGGHTEPPPGRHADAPVLSKPYTLDGIEETLQTLG